MAPPKGHPNYNINNEGRPKTYTKPIVDQYALDLIEWSNKDSSVWIKDFCLEQDLDPNIMSDWSRENNNFALAYNIAKQKQESRLFKGALDNKYNNKITVLCLTNHHGWADKSETRVSGDSQNPLTIVLDKVAGKTKDMIDDESETE